MKKLSGFPAVALVALAAAASTACGGEKSTSGGSGSGFNPPPPAEGFTRITIPVISDIGPGDDIMYCQYVLAPTDRDLDILTVGGYQSAYGHHIVAFASTATDVPLGTSRLCQGEDNTAIGAFLGGVGGENGTGNVLPPGVAFRLPKGSGLMLNTHFLNTSTKSIQGEGVLDIQFAEVDSSRKIAGFFVNVDIGFDLPPMQKSVVDNSCTAGRDLDFFAFANHMHDYGTSTYTDVTHVGGAVEMLHEDPKWSYEMQFNGVYTKWDVATPYHLVKGDVLHTHCEWNNDSSTDLQFPREMCIGTGFFLSDGSPAPMCFNGIWAEGGATAGGDGGTFIPGPPCAPTGAPGNELGVGKYCTTGGGQCSTSASICLADYTTGEWGDFCTKLCNVDADCGSGATCKGASSGSIKTCIPTSCAISADAGADGGTP